LALNNSNEKDPEMNSEEEDEYEEMDENLKNAIALR